MRHLAVLTNVFHTFITRYKEMSGPQSDTVGTNALFLSGPTWRFCFDKLENLQETQLQ